LQLPEAVWVACLLNIAVRLADALGLYQLGQLAKPDPADTEG
jgi:hypothetical protein